MKNARTHYLKHPFNNGKKMNRMEIKNYFLICSISDGDFSVPLSDRCTSRWQQRPSYVCTTEPFNQPILSNTLIHSGKKQVAVLMSESLNSESD